MSLIETVIVWFTAKPIRRLRFTEAENEFLVGTESMLQSYVDRPQFPREDILTQCLDAWRVNPLARRIKEIFPQ